MRRRMLIFACAVGAAMFALLVGTATPAAADEPTRQTVTLHRVLPGVYTCPYGPLDAVFDVTRDITTFTDNTGTPVLRIIRGYGSGTITNPATGQSLDAEVNRVFHIDLSSGTMFTVGFNTRIHLPDGGTAIVGGGQLVFDSSGNVIAEQGPDPDTEIAQVCAALAP